MKSKFRIYTDKNSNYLVAVDMAEAEISNMTMKELYLHLTNTLPVFNNGTKYTNVNKSKQQLRQWLDDYIGREKSNELLEHLLAMASGEEARKYCAYLYGEPNTGKSTFMECVSDALITTAYLDNKQQTSFSFQNIIGCRLGLWDEPEIPKGGKRQPDVKNH